MDITTILNNKGSAIAAVELQQHLAQAVKVKSRSPSEMGSEHETGSLGDQSHLYRSTSQSLPHMAHLAHYHIQAQAHQNLSGVQSSYGQPGQGRPNTYNQDSSTGNARSNGAPAPKTFHCQTCNKGFARRSDLARHERIHTGIRPHACEWPACGKQFIQRSALTVHMRVHTGEKPHMCDRCGKPFSDSSSLARHRRIHSGKRPYKCPYANCQKTFTRRTTLTRHQNHHTGTIEEAAAETEANLRQREERSSRPSEGVPSEPGSANSTPPHRGPLSPSNGLPPLNLSRHGADYFMGHSSIPPHLRSDFHHANPRAPSPGLITLSGAPPPPRPSLTSHPNSYGPPQPIEPPANSDPRPNSVAGSPHMSSVGWASPTLSSVPSPGSEYTYPEPAGQQFGGGIPPMYFSGSAVRRPQSTEPELYELRPKHHAESWSTPV
ncbi:hypothetical protein FQN57_000743 [Myotisia sp. PD_48]|nr:hypothetical protein FQN57_000743 [Myotisia sp. PD_48]